MSNKITKSTTLEGYYATGDLECFCFDTHSGPDEHFRAGKGHADDSCRTYPGDLLDKEMFGKRGRFTITVEFEPFESETN